LNKLIYSDFIIRFAVKKKTKSEGSDEVSLLAP